MEANNTNTIDEITEQVSSLRTRGEEQFQAVKYHIAKVLEPRVATLDLSATQVQKKLDEHGQFLTSINNTNNVLAQQQFHLMNYIEILQGEVAILKERVSSQEEVIQKLVGSFTILAETNSELLVLNKQKR